MASSVSSPVPLRGKLNQVKHILDDANKKLQEEVMKYEIFTTKASAAASEQFQHCVNNTNQVPTELIKTISDISTLKSVLSCPIFNRIVNVTDTLDNLSYQVNLHPSIGPSDINIDANGELILAPPMEPTCLNNLINGRLDPECLESAQNLSQIETQYTAQTTKAKNNIRGAAIERANFLDSREMIPNGSFNSPTRHADSKPLHESSLQNSQIYHNSKEEVHLPTHITDYNIEKLVSNGTTKTNLNGNKHESANTLQDRNGDQPRRLYRTSCPADPPIPGSLRGNMEFGIKLTNPNSSSTHVEGLDERSIYNNGYSNELYRAADELAAECENTAIESHQNEHTHLYNNSKSCSTNSRVHPQDQGNKSQQVSIEHSYIRNSCSPSTSVGSTVRLADECDSGASSYQSHTAKATSFNEHVIGGPRVEDETRENVDQELMGSGFSSDMQRIKVRLVKDQNGLGITIAGYTCEEEEISGIFVRSITPNSPADLSRKIRTLDQIFAVNGRELLGISNPEAVNVLRNTGREVELELMRYLAESKFQKLQTALAHAVPTSTARAAMLPQLPDTSISREEVLNSKSLNRTKIPTSAYRARAVQDDTTTAPSTTTQTKESVNITSNLDLPLEGLYKNEQVFNNLHSTAVGLADDFQRVINSQLPVAAQRNGTNKVIATKQGARNTIEIKSPVYAFAGSSNPLNLSTTADDETKRKNQPESFLNKSSSDEVSGSIPVKEPEWEKNVECVELYKDTSQGLGFTVKEYVDPRDPKQSIIMITSITPGGTAERDARLSSGDLLIFVDDTDLKNAGFNETVKALKRTNGQVRLGVLKLKRPQID